MSDRVLLEQQVHADGTADVQYVDAIFSFLTPFLDPFFWLMTSIVLIHNPFPFVIF